MAESEGLTAGGEPIRGDAQTRTSDWNLYEAEVHLYCIKPLICQGLFVSEASSNLLQLTHQNLLKVKESTER